MISQFFSSLAAPAFAALLFLYFLYRRSREINAAANDGTARGDSGAHTPAGVSEMATSSGPAKDAAANHGMASGDFGSHTSMGVVPEMATLSGADKDAAANHGIACGNSGTHTSMGVVPEMATSSGANNDAAAFNGMASGDFGTHTSTEVPETDTPSPYDYEIFLSLNGNDTLTTFADHLYTRLTKAGIHTFKYDVSLCHGKEFGTAILQAIKQSKILIPIFSKNYASRPWCLKELAQMVECEKNNRGQKIIPFFYDMGPDEVRHQSGDYGNAFRLYESEKKYDQKIIKDWRDALKAVAKIEGHDLRNRKEGEFVETFTQKVFNELNMASLGKSDYLVSVDDHVDAIMEMIGAGTSETRIIGIYGMSGIGKTTIAKIIYDKISHDFENCCFLRDIQVTTKNNGFHCVQKQLISSILKMQCEDMKDVAEGTQLIKRRLLGKRVLLLLDDVEEKDHIDALALKGKHDWLGKGSKIIITTRMVDVLKFSEVERRYELPIMDGDRSLELFGKHAFRGNSHSNQYINQSKRAISIAGGLPLALEVIGSLLFCTEKGMWDATLKMLESVPNNEILGKLKISYDKLSSQQRRVFLDIACFFSGYNKDILIHFWEESKYSPMLDMMLLQNMCLIKTTEDNEVRMHDQLRDLGRKMVRDESNMKREKLSRVWDPKEGLDLLRKHKGKKEVEALRLKSDLQPHYCFTYEDFESLSNLRFLEVDGSIKNFRAEEALEIDRLSYEGSIGLSNPRFLVEEKLPPNALSTNVILTELRWLSWRKIPPTFNITHFFMEDVVILDLSQSEIAHDWNGWSHMEVMRNLKILNLTGCRRLEKTPNFSAHSNLEHLILQDCRALVEIDGSICQLERLVSLDVRRCSNLQRLPEELGRNLASLEYLTLELCISLKRLPDSIGDLGSLIELDISGTAIKELPNSIGKLNNLAKVKMWNCEIRKIPDALWTIENLEEVVGRCACSRRVHMDIGSCNHLRILRLISADICALSWLPVSLVQLELSYLNVDTFPEVSHLTNLKELYLCFGLRRSNGESDGPVEDLLLDSHYVTTSPTDVSLPPQLKSLRLEGSNLCRLSKLPSSLSSLYLYDCKSLRSMEDLSNLKKLSSLHIESTAISEIEALGCLESLQDLKLCGLGQLKILPDLSKSDNLRRITVMDCDNLVEIQGELPRFLDDFCICFCCSLQKVPDLSSFMGKGQLNMHNCNKLNVEAILAFARKDPKSLHLVNFEQLHILPDLSSFDELTSLRIRSCDKLVEIRGELPESLKLLEIDSCGSLETLPDLSSLKELERFEIGDCKKLNGKAILGFAQRNLQHLRLFGLGQVKILPDLSNANKLRHLALEKCGNLVEIQGKLPQSLKELWIGSCESLEKLPDLSSLKELYQVLFIDCKKLKGEAFLGSAQISQHNLWESPQDLRLWGLEQMDILPDLGNLNKLTLLDVQSCGRLVEIQGDLPQSLIVFKISSCESLQKLPNLSSSMVLREFVIRECRNLVEIQGELPQSLKKLEINSCNSLQKLPDLSSSMGLREFCIDKCGNLVEIQGELPQSLEKLEINSCKSLRKLPDLSSAMGLRHVAIRYCGSLVEIQGELSQSLEKLVIFYCKSLWKLPDLSSLIGLRDLWISGCGNLVEIQGELPQSLEKLMIDSWVFLHKLPDLSSLIGLQDVNIRKCGNLVEIQGALPQSTESLVIFSCGSLRQLPNLSSSMELRDIFIHDCGSLVEIQGELPQSLEELKIDSCKSLQKLPDLLRLKGLRKIEIKRCEKLNVQAISSLCSKKAVEFVGEDRQMGQRRHESETEGEDAESESEYDGEDEE